MIGVEDWDLSQRMREASPARRLGRTQAIIRHDEGHLTLRYLLQKKYYYALHMGDYTAKHANTRAQTSPLQRYRLFLSKPRALFAKPHVGGGMLLMKTAEFAAGGLGVTSAAWKRRRSPRTQAT